MSYDHSRKAAADVVLGNIDRSWSGIAELVACVVDITGSIINERDTRRLGEWVTKESVSDIVNDPGVSTYTVNNNNAPVASALRISDGTAFATLILLNDNIDTSILREGCWFRFTNISIRIVAGSQQLWTTRWTEMKEAPAPSPSTTSSLSSAVVGAPTSIPSAVVGAPTSIPSTMAAWRSAMLPDISRRHYEQSTSPGLLGHHRTKHDFAVLS